MKNSFESMYFVKSNAFGMHPYLCQKELKYFKKEVKCICHVANND